MLGNANSQRLTKLNKLILIELDQLRVGSLLRRDVLVNISFDPKPKTRRLYGVSVGYLPVTVHA